MWDLLSILSSIAFFVIAIAYVWGCDVLWVRSKLYSAESARSCLVCTWSMHCCAPNDS